MRIDTHVHVWTADAGLIEERQYTPEVWSPVEDFIAVLDAHEMTHGLLVQASIMGTNNSYLVESLRKYPERLRGIAAIDPDISDSELDALKSAGVVGIRLNSLNASGPVDHISAEWKRLFPRLAELDWAVTFNAAGEPAAALIAELLRHKLNLVADHFGKPDLSQGVKDAAFQAICRGGSTGRTWVKLDPGQGYLAQDMRPYVDALVDALGPERLTWGSNWPWPRYHFKVNYPQHLDLLEQWFDDEAIRAKVLGANAAALFHFA